MAQSTIANMMEARTEPGFIVWVKRHPLAAYFSLAYAGSWILMLPLLLSRGLRLFSISDPIALGSFILATYTGPFLSAVLLSRVTGGPEGVRRLFKRMIQVRVGFGWYLLVFLGYPIIALAALSLAIGQNIFAFLLPQLSLIFSVYLPMTVADLFMPGIGEETGWRGFALPRLQLRYGPLLGSLILGVMHALWHLPVYLIPGMMTKGGFDPQFFLANTVAIIGLTLIWTWLFNHAFSSIFFAIVMHAASDANTVFLGKVLASHAGLPSLPWLGPAIFVPLALLLIVLTRGHLGYRPDRAPEL